MQVKGEGVDMANLNLSKFKKKIIVASLSVVFAATALTTSVNASDIQIYQNPSASNNPIIMLAIDNSLSMTALDAKYGGATVSRLAALKSSLVDALNARDANGAYKIPSYVYMGISVFTSTSEVGTTKDWVKTTDAGYPRSSKILIEAKQLNATNRADLIAKINSIGAVGSTPTPLLLSETFAYMLGNRTDGTNLDNLNSDPSTMYSNYTGGLSGSSFAPSGTKDTTGRYIAPLSKLSASDAQCSTQGVFFLTDGAPVGIRPATALPVMKNALNDASFNCDSSPLEDIYYNFGSAKPGVTGVATHNGEYKQMATGAYLDSRSPKITPDAVGNALGSTQYTWQNRSSWACVGKMVQRLSNQTQLTSSAINKRIYTSTVGFGPLFQKHSKETCTDINSDGKFDYCTFDNTYAASGTDVSNHMNAQALRLLGDVGKGDTIMSSKPIGGYSFASSGEDIQNALTNFLEAVSAGNFESASFGTYIVPTDMLSRGKPYNFVFAPQFQPKISTVNSTITSTHKLWLGNLKKYSVNNQAIMVDELNRSVLDLTGNIRSETRDFWNAANSNDGSSAIKGGMLSQLKIPTNFDLTDISKVKTRPLFINATIPTTGDNQNQVVVTNTGSLTKLTTQNVFNATYLDSTATGWQRNKYQPYLLSALGYKLSPEYLNGLGADYKWENLTQVSSLPLMQQMGGVLHSDPILVTLEAKYDETTGQILENSASNTSNRKDYMVFGSMQGLLHMVDQETGSEAFAFLPNEIIQDNDKKKALLEQGNTQQSSPNPYYGIDAPWVADVQYSIDTTNKKFKANRANIYGGMRMGGRSYYALDVKNPDLPSMLFHIDPVAGKITSKTAGVTSTSSQAKIAAMGQSWSKPTIAKVRFGDVIKNVMIVGGGYDEAYENINYQPSTDLASGAANQGAGVYIFDADSGALLWNARFGASENVTTTDVKHDQLRYSVVSQIKAFDRNTDGLVDNLYFGDLGGQVWRVDLNNALNTAQTNFGRITRLANFSEQKQRFYEMPALTIHDNGGRRFGAVSLASGNRSFPLSKTNGADNRIYVLHDYDLGAVNLFSSTYAKTKDLTEANLSNWSTITSDTIGDLLDITDKGWYYILRKTGANEETANTGTVKALNGYIAAANTNKFSDLYVSLYNPNDSSTQQPNACSGGINGSSRTLKLCLPFGVCGDATIAVDVNSKKNDTYSTSKKDGISKLNTAAILDSDGKIKSTLLGGGETKYMSTKVFKSYNWYERE